MMTNIYTFLIFLYVVRLEASCFCLLRVRPSVRACQILLTLALEKY